MSSIAPTKEQLRALLNNHKCFDRDPRTGSYDCTYSQQKEKGGEPLLMLASLVSTAGLMCITLTDGTGKVTREQVKAFLDMALTLLTPEQKANLKNWQDTRASTVALFTYQQLQWLNDHVTKSWHPLHSSK
jgi:hypothetical protein